MDYNSLDLNDADKEQLHHALVLVREVLSPDVVGAYLFGSAVIGGLRPDSDLDILVLSRRPTTLAEKQRLVHELMAMSGSRTSQGMLRRIELTIAVERDVKPWNYPPNCDFQYGDWLRDQFESGNAEQWSTTLKSDLALLITMVLIADTPVLGPRPSEVFDPVPQQDLLRAMLSDIDKLRGDIGWDTSNVILTLARIWSTAQTGLIHSKDGAAVWAFDRLPGEYRVVLARARAIYLGELTDRWDDLQNSVTACVEHLIGEIKSIARASDDHH